MRTKLNTIVQCLLIVACLSMAFVATYSVVAPVQTYCDTNGEGTTTANDDLFGTLKNVASDAQKKLVDFCLAICPLALIVTCFLAYFTHEDRRFAALIKIGITIVVVTALVLIINSGTVVKLITSWFQK